MTYAEIKTELRTLQAQGYSIPALNSKKEILETALAEILASITPEIVEAVTPAVIEPEAIALITPEVTPKRITITPEHPTLTELKEIAKGIEVALIWAIAIIRSIIRFATPRIKTALGVGLRVAVYGVVISKYYLLPKVELVAYSLGIWGLTIALKIVKSRGWAIA